MNAIKHHHPAALKDYSNKTGANANGMNALPGIPRLSMGGAAAPFGVAGAVMSGLPSLASAANPSLCLPRSPPPPLSPQQLPQRVSPATTPQRTSTGDASVPEEPRVRFSSAADLLQPPPSSKPPSRRSSALSQTIHVTTPVDGVLTSL